MIPRSGAAGAPWTPTAPGAAGVPRFWPFHRTGVLLAAVALAAALVALGSALHRFEWGDSIVPVLVSLQRWTPFYWDQERFGMLVPLLALPVRDPLWNLVLQRFLTTLAGLGAVVLVARHVLSGRDWPLAGALAVAGLLALAPARWLFEYLFDQPYGLALTLAAAGLAVAEPGPDGRRPWPRVAWGAALVIAAHWVSAAAGVVLAALAAARALADALETGSVVRAEERRRASGIADYSPSPPPGERAGERGQLDGVLSHAIRARLLWDVALLALGLAAGQLFLRLAPPPAVNPWALDLSPQPLRALPRAWATLLANGGRAAGAWPAVLAGAAAAGVLLLVLRPLRAYLPGALLRAAALVAAALAWALFAGSLRWVEANGFHWRYLAPSAVLVHLAAASLLAEPLARLRRLARPAALAALALVPAAALAAAGRPSPARVRATLDAATGRLTPDLLAARCDVVAGSYWTVWPAVWHAALALHERGEPRPLFGLAHRATPTLAGWWPRRDGLRFCRAAGEGPFADRWLRDFGLPPMRPAARIGAIEVLERDPAPQPPAPGQERPFEPPPPYW